MTISYTGERDIVVGASGAFNLVFSNVVPSSGDLLVLTVGQGAGSAATQDWSAITSAGWTQAAVANPSNESQETHAAIFYKISDGTETGINVDIGTGTPVVTATRWTGAATSGVLDASGYDNSEANAPTGQDAYSGAASSTADGAAIALIAWKDQRFAEDGTNSASNSFTIIQDIDPDNHGGDPNNANPVIAWLAYTGSASRSTTITTTDTGDENAGVIALFKAAGGGGATGTLAATESGSDTAALTGDVLIDGALAATESGSDTAALTGDVIVQGALAVTESGTDTAAATGLVLVQGALAATESGSDTAALAGLVLVQGSIASVEPGADTASIAGDVLVSGALAASETGSDTAAFTGDASLGIFGSIDAAESGSDSAQVTGLVLIQGGLAVTETGSDTAAITGPAAVSGSIAATETGSDTAAVTGLVLIYGSLATTETGSDTAAVSSFRPTVPGIEYTLPEGKAHYTLPDGRAHYTIAA